MKKKALVKKLHKPAHPVLSIFSIACAIVFFLIILAVSNRTPQQIESQNLSNIPSNASDQQTESLTPTILPASQQGWQTFVYPGPNKKYSFDYPSSWNLDSEKYPYQNTESIGVSVLYRTGNYGFKGEKFPSASSTHSQTGIFFQGQESGHGYPSSDYIRTEKHIYGGKSATVDTLYRDNKPFVTYIKFDDDTNSTASQKDSLVSIEVTYPDTGLEQYQQTKNQILNSLKVY